MTVPVAAASEVIVADGVGFDPTQRAGFGRRVDCRPMAAVGGKADIDSVTGKGTRVTLWGPR